MKAIEFYFSQNDLFFYWSITDILTEIGLLFFFFVMVIFVFIYKGITTVYYRRKKDPMSECLIGSTYSTAYTQ